MITISVIQYSTTILILSFGFRQFYHVFEGAIVLKKTHAAFVQFVYEVQHSYCIVVTSSNAC